MAERLCHLLCSAPASRSADAVHECVVFVGRMEVAVQIQVHPARYLLVGPEPLSWVGAGGWGEAVYGDFGGPEPS